MNSIKQASGLALGLIGTVTSKVAVTMLGRKSPTRFYKRPSLYVLIASIVIAAIGRWVVRSETESLVLLPEPQMEEAAFRPPTEVGIELGKADGE